MAGVALCALAVRAAAQVPVPAVTGPITGGTTGTPFVAATSFDLGPHGYVQEEFFLSGTASAYAASGPLATDGKWPAAPAGSAAYTTRIVVHRPTVAKRFNGTAIIEWLNVSAGLDAGPDWTFTHTLLIREGYAWVGVSAQAAGVVGGPSPIGLDLSLKTQDPVRYAPLVHPGDSYSYDMFTQVGAAIQEGTPLPLGDLKVRRMIAVGESQSAFRLVTYVNAIHPLVRMYDGFLIHSRARGGTALSQDPLPQVDVPAPAMIRDDIDVPVLTLQTETDVLGFGFMDARQPDTRRIRLWEVAGTAHADTYQLVAGATDEGKGALDTTYLPPLSSVAGGIITCDSPVNSGPQHYVLSAAVSQLNRWVRTGRPPRKAPRLEIADGAYVLDEHGNVRGGIRTPQVDVPIATISGQGQSGAGFCSLFGTTVPFDAAKLASLYPDHATYVRAIKKATRAAVRGGWVLKTDAKVIVASAQASNVPRAHVSRRTDGETGR